MMSRKVYLSEDWLCACCSRMACRSTPSSLEALGFGFDEEYEGVSVSVSAVARDRELDEAGGGGGIDPAPDVGSSMTI